MTKTQDRNPSRFYEIDLLRGIAVILMVIYHFLYDLEYFNIRPMPSFFWVQQYYGFPITIMFVAIAGMSLSLAASKMNDPKRLTQKLIIRGLRIFSIGLLITIITWIYPHDGFIIFGILHLIGLSTILSIPFLIVSEKLKNNISPILPAICGIMTLALTGFVQKIKGPLYLAPLGIRSDMFFTLDYEPLFPWFGVILIGMALGFWLYPNGKRRVEPPLKMRETPDILKPLSYIGRRSLSIYLIHQPVFWGILWLSGWIEMGV